MIARSSARHYRWGTECDGWHLVAADNLSVIEEQMPPGATEMRHQHQKARQFFLTFVADEQPVLAVEGIQLALFQAAVKTVNSDEKPFRCRVLADVYEPMLRGGAALVETVTTYLEQGFSLEAAARLLFVHPNTVRYRLRRVSELTGLATATGRSGFTLWVAIIIGRLVHKRT